MLDTIGRKLIERLFHRDFSLSKLSNWQENFFPTYQSTVENTWLITNVIDKNVYTGFVFRIHHVKGKHHLQNASDVNVWLVFRYGFRIIAMEKTARELRLHVSYDRNYYGMLPLFLFLFLSLSLSLFLSLLSYLP